MFPQKRLTQLRNPFPRKQSRRKRLVLLSWTIIDAIAAINVHVNSLTSAKWCMVKARTPSRVMVIRGQAHAAPQESHSLTRTGCAAPAISHGVPAPSFRHMSAISRAHRITMMWYRGAAVMEVVAGDSASYLSSFCTLRNLGCCELRSHSKSTISDVTISAPCCRARAIAASRSAGSREPIASAATSTR
jgi:hypothetical protein